jgi:hypothetical protein
MPRVKSPKSIVKGQKLFISPPLSPLSALSPFPHAPHLGPRKRVAKFCDRVGDSARALRIAAIKKA